MAKKQATKQEASETAPAEEKKPAPAAEKPAAQPQAEKAPKPAAATATAEATRKKQRRPGSSPKRGKKLRNILKQQVSKLSKQGVMSVDAAVEALKKIKRAKFDETVEVHMCLGVDVTQSDQLVRGTVSLPHGIGKSVRVLVFCQGENEEKAKAAGADYAGGDELIQKIQKENWTDFDVALATQDMMGKVSRLGKVLGPRGLMPTPKAGTVVTGDIGEAVKEFKAGKVEYRTDKSGNVHAGVGKMSFDAQKIVENISTFVNQVKAVKPSSVRGNYIKSVHISATMSPSIAVSV